MAHHKVSEIIAYFLCFYIMNSPFSIFPLCLQASCYFPNTWSEKLFSINILTCLIVPFTYFLPNLRNEREFYT